MSEEMHLVRDLAVILISAGIFTIISKALKQPLILGYIIAGFLVGPHIEFFPGITSTEAVNQWSEIGIIFLMFGLGLEFSFKKLLKVGTGALVTAGGKFIGVFVLGYVAGMAMRWTQMESIFLAGLLSMSSTTVVIKSYDEMGQKNKPWAGLVFGTLVVEDLIAILLMVLLSTMAVSNHFAGGEMLFNLAKLVFFIILWFLVGIYVIPTLLKKARKYINDEILLIVSIGLCLGMVTLAQAVGFSAALGAFVMGSILAETVESEHIEHLVRPIKDLFGAIFFVSVGMMVSPAVIAEHWFMIIIITLLVYVGHIFFAAAGIILTGKGLEQAVHTGFSLAQLGEFGFILASVGVSLGVMRDFIYPVIIAVSVITTFTTPYMMKLADPAYELLKRKLPESLLQRLEPQQDADMTHNVAEKSEWQKLLRSYATRVLLYSVVLIAVSIGSKAVLKPLSFKLLSSWPAFWRNLLVVAITLSLMTPFLYGMAVNSGSIKDSALKLIREKRSNTWPILGLILLRIFIAVGFVLAVFASHFELAGWSLVAIILAGMVFFLVARRSLKHMSAFEDRFISNLNEREVTARRKAPVASRIKDELDGFDVKIESFVLPPESGLAGKKLGDTAIRSESGASILKIIRGSREILIPSPAEVVFPCDCLVAVGTALQLGCLKQMIESSASSAPTAVEKGEFKVEKLVLREESYLTGKTLREADLKSYRCMVVSVLHGGALQTNPRPDLRFAVGDTVWIAGLAESVDWLK